jgi:hypothetical protein
MPERADFLKLLEKKKEGEAKAHAFRQELLKQASVKAEHLTKNEHWDFFLSLMQAKLDEATVASVEWMERCALANTDADWHIAQRAYFEWKSRVQTLEEVMSLPITLTSAKTAQ